MLTLLLAFTPESPPAKEPSFVIRRPTVIAFFPPVTKKDLKSDESLNESLGDFQIYAKQARDRLAKMGITFESVYARAFRLRVGTKVITFRPGAEDVGYYFIAPGKTPRIEYGVATDDDLALLSTQYFGIPER